MPLFPELDVLTRTILCRFLEERLQLVEPEIRILQFG
jgi:hypothetical protein